MNWSAVDREIIRERGISRWIIGKEINKEIDKAIIDRGKKRDREWSWIVWIVSHHYSVKASYRPLWTTTRINWIDYRVHHL